jgi:hypothetical protein
MTDCWTSKYVLGNMDMRSGPMYDPHLNLDLLRYIYASSSLAHIIFVVYRFFVLVPHAVFLGSRGLFLYTFSIHILLS